jgi:hypothetical protein
MNRFNTLFRISIACLLIVNGCVEPYDSPATKNPQDFLVIDGFLNTTNGSAKITIKHSTPLDSDNVPIVETGAMVEIKDDNGNAILLFQTQPGRYERSGIVYDQQRKYTVYIKTMANKEYESAPILLKQTPEIDSITWALENDNVEVYVNTHDEANESRYYKWNAIETFKYHSKYASGFILEDGWKVINRPPASQIYFCWDEQPVYATSIASTTHLIDDVVSKKKIVAIPAGSLKISSRYSINIQQISLTEEAYLYWKDVQQTSEDLGSLFDPLPGQVVGNIHSLTNPSEPVIGYIGGGSVSEKRLYIDDDELPTRFRNHIYPPCLMDTIPVRALQSVSNPNALIEPVYDGLTVIGYLSAAPPCIDCRLFAGGTTQKPDFWIE